MFREYLKYSLRRGLFGSLIALGVGKAMVIAYTKVRKTKDTEVC